MKCAHCKEEISQVNLPNDDRWFHEKSTRCELFATPESAAAAPADNNRLPAWVDPNCGCCGGSGYTSLGGCYVCQKRAAAAPVPAEPGWYYVPGDFWAMVQRTMDANFHAGLTASAPQGDAEKVTPTDEEG